MCGGRGGRSVAPMTYTTPIRSLAGAVIAVLLLRSRRGRGLCRRGRQDARPEGLLQGAVLHLHDRRRHRVARPAPRPRPQPGDSFEIDSLDYRGTHKKHSKKPIGADYLQCSFGTGPEPDCHGYTALGNSLLRFHGFDLIGAIGKFKDAKVLSSKEVPGGSDFVIRLTRR